MCIAGNPLVYVNAAFCDITGYSKAEAHGRNCRFLQGPETELAAVAALVDAQRRGAECNCCFHGFLSFLSGFAW